MSGADCDGTAVLRVEDLAMLTGRRRYVDDIEPRGTLHLAMVRSRVAHGKIDRIDATAATAHPGVHAVLTGETLERLIHPTPITWSHIPGQRSTGSIAMATDKVRYVGHIVAAVVADSRAEAEDAAETVLVDIAPLPAVIDVEEALRPGTPLLHEHWPDNVLAVDRRAVGDVATALDKAPHVEELELRVGRAFACPLETRAVVADWTSSDRATPTGEGSGRLELTATTQSPNRLREVLAEVLGIPLSDIRIKVPSVGGGFGAKANYYGEEIIAAVASRVCRRPVKYVEDRSESFVATSHAREARMRIVIGARPDGSVLGYRNEVVGTLGGELSSVGMGPIWVSTHAGLGSYAVQHAEITVTGVMTNRTPFGSYRGWGSPMANFAIERAVDAVAGSLGLDPVEVRLRNMIPPASMPYDNGLGWRLDSGDYPNALRRLRDAVAELGWLEERGHARAQGGRVGIGYANFVEATGVGNSRAMAERLDMDQGGFDESVVRLDSTGTVQVRTGQTSIGQGVETTLAQVCAETLGARIDHVRVITGDTDSCPYTGYGTAGCRTAAVSGSSVVLASRILADRIRETASHLLDTPVDDLTIRDSAVHSPSGERVTFGEIGMAAYRRIDRLPPTQAPTLEARSVWDPVDRTFGYGSVAVMVEVDGETGITSVLRYHVIDDCGKVVNSAVVDGQIMGAFVQILGSSLMEVLRYGDDGQPVTTSFDDYFLPLAADAPRMSVEHLETLPPDVPSGSKGVGEAGTIAGMAAIAQAVEDALSDGFGWIRSIPIDPSHVLQRIDLQQTRSRLGYEPGSGARPAAQAGGPPSLGTAAETGRTDDEHPSPSSTRR